MTSNALLIGNILKMKWFILHIIKKTFHVSFAENWMGGAYTHF